MDLQKQIRPIALCVIRRDDAVFVFEGYDPLKDQVFYRPLGGGIEFGETSEQAVRREMREEIGAELVNLRYWRTMENIFTFDGRTGHEIVLLYEGEFADQSFYNQSLITGREDNGAPFKALWKPIADFHNGCGPLYPDGLLELLSS
ncbi:MAG TPA: NUDIX domain-containing protein [Chromatiaceae bacterium]|nr:NUDIX domain-containing protein [Chromatiaceae bacterium]